MKDLIETKLVGDFIKDNKNRSQKEDKIIHLYLETGRKVSITIGGEKTSLLLPLDDLKAFVLRCFFSVGSLVYERKDKQNETIKKIVAEEKGKYKGNIQSAERFGDGKEVKAPEIIDSLIKNESDIVGRRIKVAHKRKVIIKVKGEKNGQAKGKR